MEPATEPSKDVRQQTFLLDPPAAAGSQHYAAAMALVACIAIGTAYEAGRTAPTNSASQTEEALMVELPPVEAGAHPQGDDAPPQEAAPAATGTQAPQPMPEPAEEAPQNPPSPSAEKVPETPVAELRQAAEPLPQSRTPASAPAVAHDAGAPTPTHAAADVADDTETRHASAHLITLWQKALMGRLQAARHGLATHATGVARIAFAIDRDGHLVSARVAHGSGSATVDAAALGLVRRAAPFPTPPPGAGDGALTFVVPISFRHGD